jgi:hypothetical protein
VSFVKILGEKPSKFPDGAELLAKSGYGNPPLVHFRDAQASGFGKSDSRIKPVSDPGANANSARVQRLRKQFLHRLGTLVHHADGPPCGRRELLGEVDAKRLADSSEEVRRATAATIARQASFHI